MSLYGIATAVLQAAVSALATTQSGAPIVSYVALGEVAWDGCDSCGQLTVTLVAPFLADSIETVGAVTDQTPCAAAGVGATFVLQLVRCVPTVDERGDPPTPAAMSASAAGLMADYEAMLPEVMCALADLRDADTIVGFTVGPGQVRGPEGACAGIDLPFTVVSVR